MGCAWAPHEARALILSIYLFIQQTLMKAFWFLSRKKNSSPAGSTLRHHELNNSSCFIWLHKLELTPNESSWSGSEKHPSAVLRVCPPVTASVNNLYSMPHQPVNRYRILLPTRQLVKAVHPKQTPRTQGDVSKTQGGPWNGRRMRKSLRNPFSLTLPSQRAEN